MLFPIIIIAIIIALSAIFPSYLIKAIRSETKEELDDYTLKSCFIFSILIIFILLYLS